MGFYKHHHRRCTLREKCKEKYYVYIFCYQGGLIYIYINGQFHKVGGSYTAISEPWVQIKWATSKSTQLSTKMLGQTAPSAWKCPKVPPVLWPITNKHREWIKKLQTDILWHPLNSRIQVRTHCHAKIKDLATCGFQQKFHTHPLAKTHWSWTQFQKGQPTSYKTGDVFHAPL